MDYLNKYLKTNSKYYSLSSKSIAIVGLGSIGSLSAQLLSRAGILRLLLVDMDAVEKHNIQNQLYVSSDIGKPKAIALKSHIMKSSPKGKILAVAKQINPDSVSLLGKQDVILDCTDNMQARFLLNDYCKSEGTAFLHSAVSGADYQIAIFPHNGPCFRCIFPKNSTGKTCQAEGLLTGIAQLAASIQTAMCIKYLSTKNQESILIKGNIWGLDHNVVRIKKKPRCPCCEGVYEFLSESKTATPRKLCRSKSYLFSYTQEFSHLKNKFKRTKGFRNLNEAFMLENATVFSDGRILVRAETEAQAKKVKRQVLE